MPDGTHLKYSDTPGYEKMLYSDIQPLIMQGNTFNDEDESSLISDIRQFNIRGKNEISEFDLYWKTVIRAMETEIAHRAYERIHAAGDYDATNRISHVTFISTNHLIKITIQILEKY